MAAGSVYCEDNYPVEFSFPATRHQIVERGQVFASEGNGCVQGAGTETRLSESVGVGQPRGEASGRGPPCPQRLCRLGEDAPSKMKLQMERGVVSAARGGTGTCRNDGDTGSLMKGQALGNVSAIFGEPPLLGVGGGALCAEATGLPSRAALPVTLDLHVARAKGMG